MICPNCGSEYREGFARCSDCDVDLIEPQPEAPAESDVPLVKVFESGNAALIPLIESVFSDAGIDFMTKGESIQDLFGAGRLGTNLNFVIGPVEFYVTEQDAEEARRIVADLAQPVPPADKSESGE